VDNVFLDANVLFSAAYGSRRIGRLWELARTGACVLVTSAYAVGECRRNLTTTLSLEALEARLERVSLVPPAPEGQPCPVDLVEKDRPILLAAACSGSTHLLTGDRSHFGPFYRSKILGVLILAPADYLAGKPGR
jgi:hypothetical protein